MHVILRILVSLRIMHYYAPGDYQWILVNPLAWVPLVIHHGLVAACTLVLAVLSVCSVVFTIGGEDIARYWRHHVRLT